jgi:hypothetical protein
MSYDFWDYFWGYVILACFFVPFIGAILVQVLVFFVAMFGTALGLGIDASQESRVSIRINPYDTDEDR